MRRNAAFCLGFAVLPTAEVFGEIREQRGRVVVVGGLRHGESVAVRIGESRYDARFSKDRKLHFAEMLRPMLATVREVDCDFAKIRNNKIAHAY